MPQGLVWRDVVAADVRRLAAGPPARIDCWYAAARLFDTSHRALVEGLIRAAPRDQIAANASLSYVAACMAENEGRLSDALCHFTDAWSLRSPDDFRLTARVAYESCFLELMRSNRMAAESIADAARAYFARSLEIVPDLELINALMADHAGDRVEAIAHHRLAIRHAANALTPATLIRAQVNLAVALEHVEPSEAVALCEHALRSLESEGLNERMRPGILNVYAYALLCASRPASAFSSHSIARSPWNWSAIGSVLLRSSRWSATSRGGRASSSSRRGRAFALRGCSLAWVITPPPEASWSVSSAGSRRHFAMHATHSRGSF